MMPPRHPMRDGTSAKSRQQTAVRQSLIWLMAPALASVMVHCSSDPTLTSSQESALQAQFRLQMEYAVVSAAVDSGEFGGREQLQAMIREGAGYLNYEFADEEVRLPEVLTQDGKLMTLDQMGDNTEAYSALIETISGRSSPFSDTVLDARRAADKVIPIVIGELSDDAADGNLDIEAAADRTTETFVDVMAEQLEEGPPEAQALIPEVNERVRVSVDEIFQEIVAEEDF